MPPPSTKMIEDPDTYYMLNRIGSRNLSYIGALLQIWENKTKEGLALTFAEWIMNEDFVQTTKRACTVAGEDIVSLRKELAATKEQLEESKRDIRTLIGTTKEGLEESKRDFGALIDSTRKELAATKEELEESKQDISRLINVNKDLYNKYEQLQNTPPPIPPVPAGGSLSINRVRSMLRRFNRENPVAVANGDARGVTFGGHVKITDFDSLAAFLESKHARKMGLPSDILRNFKVFVLDGKLVTLSDEYHGGVGFSYLWSKKSRKQAAKGGAGAAVSLSVGWSTATAKKYDPRLGIDPATGVRYIDPETGEPWAYPQVSPPASAEKQKRSGQELSSATSDKKAKVAA